MIILCWGPLLSARLVPKSSIFTPKTSNLEHELSRNLFLLFLPLAANWSLTDQCFQNEKAVSLDSRYEGTKSFTPCPQKIGFLAEKRPKLAQNWHFGPNIGIFGPFDLRPDQKTMRTNCLGGFCYVGTKTFTYSHKN